MGNNLEFRIFLFQLIVFVLLASPILGFIEFYDHGNYKGLLHRADTITTSCETLPRWTWNKAYSIKTSNCVFLYSHPNCQGRSFRLEAGNNPALRYFVDDTDSYRACNDVSASSYLKDVRVKFYEDNNYGRILLDTPIPNGCKTLPSGIHNRASSIETDVCIILYSHSDCNGRQFRLVAGRSPNLPYFNKDTDSFRPCNVDDVINGFKLNAKIVKFEIWSDPSEVKNQAKTGSILMDQQTCFWNNGSSTITQNYAVSKTVTEKVQLEKTTSYSKMHTTSVSAQVGFQTSVGIPLLARTKITASLKTSYQYISQMSGSSSEKYLKETQKGFSVSQAIQVSPCTLYKVNSIVKTTENYPVRYKVYSEVTGVHDNGGRLTATVFRQKLTGLKYDSTKDEHTIIATSESRLNVDYAVDTAIVGNGRPIENCLQTRALSESGQMKILNEC